MTFPNTVGKSTHTPEYIGASEIYSGPVIRSPTTKAQAIGRGGVLADGLGLKGCPGMGLCFKWSWVYSGMVRSSEAVWTRLFYALLSHAAAGELGQLRLPDLGLGRDRAERYASIFEWDEG